jgi:beta-glucosidase
MAEKLSDRVRHFFTLNEIRNFTDTCYRGLEVKVGGGVVCPLYGTSATFRDG